MNAISVSENRRGATMRLQIPFVPVPGELLMMPNCSLRSQLIHFWGVVWRYSSAKGYAWFYRRTIADKLGVTVRTIARWLAKLIELGLIRIQRTGRNSRYFPVENSVDSQPCGTSEGSKMSHRYKDELEHRTTEILQKVSDSSRSSGNVEKPAAAPVPTLKQTPPLWPEPPDSFEKVEIPAAQPESTLKTLTNEEFLKEWRREKQRASLDHAGAAIFRMFASKLGLRLPDEHAD